MPQNEQKNEKRDGDLQKISPNPHLIDRERICWCVLKESYIHYNEYKENYAEVEAIRDAR